MPKFHLEPTDDCPNCGHGLGIHNSDGCTVGWDDYHDKEGAPPGCYCPLALVS